MDFPNTSLTKWRSESWRPVDRAPVYKWISRWGIYKLNWCSLVPRHELSWSCGSKLGALRAGNIMHTAELALSLLLVVIIVVSLLSNVLVLICFLYNAEIRKQVPGLFILNLTFCNLLLSVSSMPLTLIGVLSKAHPGGHLFCQVVGFLDTFLTTNSMLSMAALSIDRWVAVVFPLSYHSRIRHRDAVIALAYTWVHSLSFSVVATCLSWVGYHQLYASCTLCNGRAVTAKTQFAIYTMMLHSLTFLLVSVVLCITYLKVLKVARFHCKRIDVITMQTLVLLVDIHPR